MKRSYANRKTFIKAVKLLVKNGILFEMTEGVCMGGDGEETWMAGFKLTALGCLESRYGNQDFTPVCKNDLNHLKKIIKDILES